MPSPQEKKNLRIAGLVSIVVVALLAIVLISMDSADDRQTPQGVPSEAIESGETQPSPPNETPVADPSGPYQPQ